MGPLRSRAEERYRRTRRVVDLKQQTTTTYNKRPVLKLRDSTFRWLAEGDWKEQIRTLGDHTRATSFTLLFVTKRVQFLIRVRGLTCNVSQPSKNASQHSDLNDMNISMTIRVQASCASSSDASSIAIRCRTP